MHGVCREYLVNKFCQTKCAPQILKQSLSPINLAYQLMT